MKKKQDYNIDGYNDVNIDNFIISDPEIAMAYEKRFSFSECANYINNKLRTRNRNFITLFLNKIININDLGYKLSLKMQATAVYCYAKLYGIDRNLNFFVKCNDLKGAFDYVALRTKNMQLHSSNEISNTDALLQGKAHQIYSNYSIQQDLNNRPIQIGNREQNNFQFYEDGIYDRNIKNNVFKQKENYATNYTEHVANDVKVMKNKAINQIDNSNLNKISVDNFKATQRSSSNSLLSRLFYSLSRNEQRKLMVFYYQKFNSFKSDNTLFAFSMFNSYGDNEKVSQIKQRIERYMRNILLADEMAAEKNIYARHRLVLYFSAIYGGVPNINSSFLKQFNKNEDQINVLFEACKNWYIKNIYMQELKTKQQTIENRTYVPKVQQQNFFNANSPRPVVNSYYQNVFPTSNNLVR